jgi:seryl-tRNA synthetase
LNQALINYGFEFLSWKVRSLVLSSHCHNVLTTSLSSGYSPNQPPYFLNKSQIAKTAQLSQFDEELYKVVESTPSTADKDQDTDKYLIATSEQPLSCAHASKWLLPSQLPIK